MVLEFGRPFCNPMKLCGMYALYTNYNIEKRHFYIDGVAGIDKVIAEMNTAMNECGNTAKLMWWFDMNNPIVGVLRPPVD